MKAPRKITRFAAGVGLVLAFSVASTARTQEFLYFDGNPSSDFSLAANWDLGRAPGSVADDIVSIDDGLSSTYSSGSTSIAYLRVGSADKTHSNGVNQFGRLTMTGGTIEVTGVNTLAVGRENLSNYIVPLGGDYDQSSVVDGADFLVWQRGLGSSTDLAADGDHDGTIGAGDLQVWKNTFSQSVSGGQIVMTGSSTLRTNGALIGERSKGSLSIGPSAVVDVRIWDTTVTPNQFGGTEDMRVGTWGPAYETFGGEPGLNGNGLVDVQGTLNAKDMYLSEHGAKGELRVAGGNVNLNGELIMDLCAGCVSDPTLLATRSSKVTIVGSGGSFKVGLDPDLTVVDPMPPPRDISAASSTDTFSFTADAGGVTPIVVVDNVGEASGFAKINTAKLQLNLDAYTSSTPLTLINAPAGHLDGTFGSVSFLGHRTATVNYDTVNGDVILTNFHSVLPALSLTATAVPEPASLLLAIAGAGVLATTRRGRRR